MEHRSRFYRVLLVALAVSGFVWQALRGAGGAPAGQRAAVERARRLLCSPPPRSPNAFGELAKTFEKQNPGVEVRQSFESSSTLLTQIQQGAPADVFASAAEDEMDTAINDGLVAGEPEVFVKNREVIMVPKDNPAHIRTLQDVARPGVRLVLAQEDVPAADYALEILDKANNTYGSTFKRDVLSNIVSREADVRASVNRVVVADADATFGYASDYTPDIRERVQLIEIPKDLNIVATYPIAATKDAKSPQLAQQWVELVLSEEGQRVLKKWGFEPAA